MRRLFLTALVTAAACILAGVWWYGGPFADSSDQQNVPGLQDSTTIRWTSNHIPVIDTGNNLDAVSALGYIHGLERGWTVVLWRQTALGRLSHWFGTKLTPLDRHTRRLGLARHARATFNRLPDTSKAVLRAYAQGMNTALEREAVRRSASFALLDVEPARWAPWHTLLIERLLSWLSTPVLSPTSTMPSSLHRFTAVDRKLRRWLHLHGWDRSVAWAVRPPSQPDSSRPFLFQRHVLGASASPIIQEVIWNRPTASTITWGTLPGSLIFPTGTTDDRAWTSLLQSQARLVRVPFDSSALRHWYERLEPSGGDEQLLQIERIGNTLPLGLAGASSPPVPDTTAAISDSLRTAVPDTAWAVRWAGFRMQSNLTGWLQRGGLHTDSSSSSPFPLFEADGLQVSADGTWSVLGTPSVVEEKQHTLVVGQPPWAQEHARSLGFRVAANDSVTVGSWSASDSSAWAASLFPHLEPALAHYSQMEGPVRNAATYLRNWDFHYTPSSIGAVLFEEWMYQYGAELGRVPTLADTTVYFARYRQRQALGRALDSLLTRLGPNVRRWRWGRVVTDRRFFPVWSADSLVDASLQDLASTQFAPLERTGRGHPSALSGGPSHVDPVGVAPSPDQWEGWMRPGDPMRVRRHRYDPSVVFARPRLRDDLPPTERLTLEEETTQTLLVPPPE